MRVPTGRWRIVEMDRWDHDAIDLFIHRGDDSRFRATPFARTDQRCER